MLCYWEGGAIYTPVSFLSSRELSIFQKHTGANQKFEVPVLSSLSCQNLLSCNRNHQQCIISLFPLILEDKDHLMRKGLSVLHSDAMKKEIPKLQYWFDIIHIGNII